MINFGNYTLTEAEQSRVIEVQRLGKQGAAKIPELIAMLTDPSWVVRRAVVEALAEIGEPALGPLCETLVQRRDSEARIAATVDALVASRGAVEPSMLKLVNHPDPAIVADVAQVLGRRRSTGSVPVLVELTRHQNDNVAVGAIEGLGRIGGRAAVEALVEIVGSGNFFRTFPAIDVLGRSGDPRAVEPLVKLLSNPSYLPEAARALGRTGERSAVKPLLALLKSASDAIVRVAAASLWELRERFEDKSGGGALLIDEMIRAQVGSDIVRRLSQVLPVGAASESMAVCRLLGAIGNAEAAPALTAALDMPAPVSNSAAEALQRISKSADEPLLQAIREGNSSRRRVLLPVVTRSAAAVDVVLCLRDPDPEVRALACDTLARLGNGKVVAEIFPLLGDPNLRVVHSATGAIQALGTREARLLSIEAAQSPNPVVRRSALRILAYFGESASLQPMLDGLNDPDPRVRDVALQGLPFLEDHRALEALFDATKNTVAKTRALAMRSLGQVPKGNERIYSVLLKGLSDSDSWVRYYACQALGRLGYAAGASEIARLLEDQAGQVRVSAVEALSHLDSPAAHAALRRAATSEDVDVKRAALVGLGIVHRVDDLPVVLAAASSADVPTRLMALSALVSFPSPLVLGALSSAASDPDEQVSATAIGYLAARPEQEATEVLVELLASDSTRERARSALLVPSDGRVAGLLVALESAGDELAPHVVSILSRIERSEARAALVAAMKLLNVAARKAAATGLAARRDLEALVALREAAESDPNPEVRQISSLLLRE